MDLKLKNLCLCIEATATEGLDEKLNEELIIYQSRITKLLMILLMQESHWIQSKDRLDLFHRRINDHRINKKFLLEGKKKSQANSYMKEGRLLKSLKKTSNTMSTGFIQPYNKIVLDSYDSSIMNPNKISRCSLKDETLVSKIIHSQNHVSSDWGRKPKSSMRQNYLKRNK